jgi:hypothetical protein
MDSDSAGITVGSTERLSGRRPNAAVFCSSGFGDPGRHDIEIIFFLTCGNEEFLRRIFNIENPQFFDNAGKCVASNAENLTLLPQGRN